MPDTQTVEVGAERLKLKVGTLECDLDAASLGVVKLDGAPTPVRSLTVYCRAGRPPKITLEIVPLPSRHRVTATEDKFRREG